MADPKISATLVGCTGLVGSHMLTSLLSHPSAPNIHAIARRELSQTSNNLSVIANADTSTWSTALKSFSPPPKIFLSALGTTKAAAGSIAAQRAIDYDLNLSLAQAAKENGTEVYVLISSGGVGPSSPWPYGKMKYELEEAVKKLEFPYTVILKPGLLVGSRHESRPAEAGLRIIARGLGAISGGVLKDFWALDADVVGRAAVRAGWDCVEGKREKGVWVLGHGDVLKLGKSKD